MTIAICSRVLQFRAGPDHKTFYACEAHQHILTAGDISSFDVPLFFATEQEPVQPVDPEDEYPCDFCREG